MIPTATVTENNLSIFFSSLLKEQTVQILVSAGALFFGPTGWRLSRQLPSLSVGKGMRQWSQTPGYGLQQSHTTVRMKEQELERFWFGPESLNHFTSWIKSRGFISLRYLQCSGFPNIHPKLRTTIPQRTVQWTMYRIYKEFYTVVYIPLTNRPLYFLSDIKVFFSSLHHGNCWLNHPEQVVARSFHPFLG